MAYTALPSRQQDNTAPLKSFSDDGKSGPRSPVGKGDPRPSTAASVNNSSGESAISSAAIPAKRPGVGEPRQWAYISDQVVKLTTLEEVLKAKAYLCLYERI